MVDLSSLNNSRTDYSEVIEKMVMELLHKKDKMTFDHCIRVSKISIEISRLLNLNEQDIGLLIKSALFHDIGKIAINQNILNKSGSLSNSEWKEMKNHPLYGEAVFKYYIKGHEGRMVGKIIRHHHEHYNGKGYPDGLIGEEIPLLSRIISVADVFDALTSKRPYRGPFSLDAAVSILKDISKDQLDPILTELFINKVIKY